MTKILVINHGLEYSGWGQAARDYLLAMDSVGLDIVARFIKPNKNSPSIELSPQLQKLANKSVEGCNICIQHLLPHLMDYDGRFDKNIALFVVETDQWHHSGWHDYINQMDEVWVPNTFMLETAKDNRIKIPVKLVPHACDTSKYEKDYGKLDIEPTRGNYKFYFIGEYNRRKRISALIQAYFLAFTRNDPVSLILKVNRAGMDPKAIFDSLQQEIAQIKSSHKLHIKEDRHPHIVIMPEYMAENDICRLHNGCDCFVNTSFGEAWSYPTFDAMGFNKNIITGTNDGPIEFLKHYNKCHFVKGIQIPVFGMNETFSQLNTARENWMSVDIRDVAWQMRNTFNGHDYTGRPASLPANNLQCIQEFSYKNIGNKIKELLCI